MISDRIELSHQRAVIWAILGAVLVTAISAVISFTGIVTHEAIQAVPGVIFLLVSVAIGTAVVRGQVTAGDRQRFLTWVTIGGLAFGAFGMWYPLLGAVGGEGIAIVYGLFTTVTAGVLFGTLVGAYDVLARQRERAEQAALETQRETVTLLNGLLRHHLLNGINVVGGHAQLLEGHVDEDGREHLNVVRSRSEQMTETIQNLRRIARQLTEAPDPSPIRLAPIVDGELDRARNRHEEAIFEAETIPGDLEVYATDSLEIVLSHALTNAVQHNDADTPRVYIECEVSEDTVSLAVADNGPGVPEAQRAEIFEASVRGEDSVGEGLGLYLCSSVIEQYGGELWVEDSDDGGARFVMALRRGDS